MNKIYTKTGDHGMTRLADGTRVVKSSERITACGCIDELNAFLGLALAYIKEITAADMLLDRLLRIQQELMLLNSQLALASLEEIITMKNVTKLEQEIDELNANLPPFGGFVLPGDNKNSAYLHVARTVCRRAERAIVKLAENNAVNNAVMPYLNRLSDWLFVAARFIENVDGSNLEDSL